MRIHIIILLFITNLSLGQEKVSIDQNVVKYEIKDEFERFDDIEPTQNDFKGLSLIQNTDSDIEIANSYGGGFIGYDIYFKIDKNLNIKNVTYNYWTDNIDLDNIITYKVCKANLSLNQNPFINLKELRGKYTFEIERYCNGDLMGQEIFKGKFKTFREINKNSADYKWALKQDKGLKNVKNLNGVYLSPENPPNLISDSRILIEELEKVSEFKNKNIKAFVVINENGIVEKSPIRFSIKLTAELEMKLTVLLIQYTKWNPAKINGKAVKSQIPVVISTE